MEDIKIPSKRSFGIVFFIVFLIIAIYPLIRNGELRVWSLIISIIFLILGLMNSKLLNGLNKLWFKFGILIGGFTSPIIMGMIFFFVVTPIGLMLRIFRKDVLNLKFNNAKSYWKNKSGQISKMKNQF